MPLFAVRALREGGGNSGRGQKCRRTGHTDSEQTQMQFALSQDEQGTPVVVVEEDILDGVTIGNEKILITKKSRKEITNSGDTGWLRKNQPDVYADKMRSSANADEILMATTDKKNEPPDHHRKDDIVSFDVGNVQISVGGTSYTAEVMIGNKSNGEKLLYDFVRMTKKEEMQRTVGRQSAPHSSHAASLFDNSVAQSGYPVKADFVQDGGAGVICTKKEAIPTLESVQSQVLDTLGRLWLPAQYTRRVCPCQGGWPAAHVPWPRNRPFRHACAERSPPDTIPDTEKRRIMIPHDSPSGAVDGT